MSVTLDQTEGFAALLRSRFMSSHDVIDELSKNWDPIYIGGGGNSICKIGDV